METVAINYPAQDFDELGDETVIPGEGVMRRAGEQVSPLDVREGRVGWFSDDI